MAADIHREVVLIDIATPRIFTAGDATENILNVSGRIPEKGVTGLTFVMPTSASAGSPVLQMTMRWLSPTGVLEVPGTDNQWNQVTGNAFNTFGVGPDTRNMTDLTDELLYPIPPQFDLRLTLESGTTITVDWLVMWVN